MDHGDHGSGDAQPACKISMLLNWYTLDACFLTRSWHVSSHAGFAASCVATVLLVVAVEALRRGGRAYDERVRQGFVVRARAAVALDGKTAAAAANGASASGSAAYRDADGGADGAGDGHAAVLAEVAGAGRGSGNGSEVVLRFRATPVQQLVRALIHAATFGLAYVVMLLAMYYNGYILVSILVGAVLGKFLCDWQTETVMLGAGGEERSGHGHAAGGVVEEPTVCCG